MYKINDTWVLNPSLSVIEILEKNQEYHEGMINLAISLCSKKRVFIDVGACYGLITRQMAKVAERVLAFEPNFEILDCLRKNTLPFKNVELFNLGLSNENKNKFLLLYENDGRSTYRKIYYLNALKHIKTLRNQSTKVITLDSLLLKDVDLIKIDVEGHEKHVLQGSLKTIARCKPVIIVEQNKGVIETKYIPKALSLLGYTLHSSFREKDYIYVHR